MSQAEQIDWEGMIADLERQLLKQRIRRAVIGGIDSIKRVLHPIDTPPTMPAGSGNPAMFSGQLAPAMIPADVLENAKVKALQGVNRLYRQRAMQVPGRYTRDYFG